MAPDSESNGPAHAQRWGPDDERGALNLLGPEVVLAASTAVRTGKVYPLGLPIQRSGVPIIEFRGAPQRLTLINAEEPNPFEPYGAPANVGANEDMLILASHSITHLDALCHVHSDGAIYNGFPAASFTTHAGALRCGIEKVGAIAGRGVLLDMPAARGVEWLQAGEVLTGADLQSCADAQGVEVRSGDIVLVRTGWIDYWFSLGGAGLPPGQPGIGFDAARWLKEKDVAVVGSDNSAVEAIPFDRGVYTGVHLDLLMGAGIYLLEHLRLTELARDGVHECLLVVSPLLVTGAAGSPVNPVAIA